MLSLHSPAYKRLKSKDTVEFRTKSFGRYIRNAITRRVKII